MLLAAFGVALLFATGCASLKPLSGRAPVVIATVAFALVGGEIGVGCLYTLMVPKKGNAK